jgi:hypothetical protein
MTPWEIKGKVFANCNCSYGCPCQFNALPTNGFCEAVTMEIEEGHCGEVKLDGLRMGGIFQWPGPCELPKRRGPGGWMSRARFQAAIVQL